MLSTELAYLVATLLQVFLYALYLMSFAHVLRWLFYVEEGWTLKSRDKVNWTLSTITIILFVISTTDVGFAIARLMTSTFDIGPDAGDLITDQLNIAIVAIENGALLIADAVLIIRCWLVYQKSWHIILVPIVLWATNLACTATWLVTYTKFVFGVVPSELVITPHSFRALYSCHFATNLYATTAILCRLWHAATGKNNSRALLFRVSRIIATTGILYTCTSLPLVVATFYIDSYLPVYLICDALNFSVAGITFNLLYIRMGQLRAEFEIGDDENPSRSILLSTVQMEASDMTTIDRSLNPASVRQCSKNVANVVKKSVPISLWTCKRQSRYASETVTDMSLGPVPHDISIVV